MSPYVDIVNKILLTASFEKLILIIQLLWTSEFLNYLNWSVPTEASSVLRLGFFTMKVSPDINGLEANLYLPLDTLMSCSYFWVAC